MQMLPNFIFRLAIAALSASLAWAQPEEVNLEQIMAHPDWLGRQLESAYWADDGNSVYFERKEEGSEERPLYHMGLDGTLLGKVAEEDMGAADFASGAFRSDRKRKIYSRHGDLFVRDVETGP